MIKETNNVCMFAETLEKISFELGHCKVETFVKRIEKEC